MGTAVDTGFGYGRMSLRADSLDEAARTVLAVVSTDQPVKMFDPEEWRFIDEILVAAGGSFPERVPLLDSHVRDSVGDVLGGVSEFTQSGGRWVARLEFDTDDPSERAFNKVRKRFVTDVSVGYEVQSAVTLDPGQSEIINGTRYEAKELPLRVSTRWRGKEVSLAAIGADDQAKIRGFVRSSFGNVRGIEVPEPNAKDAALAREIDGRVRSLARRFAVPAERIHADMASASGLERAEIDLMLAGEIRPDREHLEGIAAALETDVEPLLIAAEM